MDKVRPGSILLGVLTDKLLFIAAALTLALILGTSNPAFQILVMPVGFGTIVCGGFVAAWHARSHCLLHGLAVGGLGVVISSARFGVNILWPPSEAAALHPLWWELLGWVGAPVAGLVGGWLAFIRAQQSPREPRPASVRWAWWIPAYLAVIVLFAFAEQF